MKPLVCFLFLISTRVSAGQTLTWKDTPLDVSAERITFEQHAAIYHVDPQASGAKKILKILRQSRARHRAVRVTVEPTALTILSAH